VEWGKGSREYLTTGKSKLETLGPFRRSLGWIINVHAILAPVVFTSIVVPFAVSAVLGNKISSLYVGGLLLSIFFPLSIALGYHVR
jgi:hypothetical protein